MWGPVEDSLKGKQRHLKPEGKRIGLYLSAVQRAALSTAFPLDLSATQKLLSKPGGGGQAQLRPF